MSRVAATALGATESTLPTQYRMVPRQFVHSEISVAYLFRLMCWLLTGTKSTYILLVIFGQVCSYKDFFVCTKMQIHNICNLLGTRFLLFYRFNNVYFQNIILKLLNIFKQTHESLAETINTLFWEAVGLRYIVVIRQQ